MDATQVRPALRRRSIVARIAFASAVAAAVGVVCAHSGRPLQRGRNRPRRPDRKRAIARIASRRATSLQSARSKLPDVAVSAFTGLPPLAAVAVAAGTTSTKRSGFAAACFTGRALRFGLIAYGMTALPLH
jgi:membrane protein YqaA with SNARE-associated domain